MFVLIKCQEKARKAVAFCFGKNSFVGGESDSMKRARQREQETTQAGEAVFTNGRTLRKTCQYWFTHSESQE